MAQPPEVGRSRYRDPLDKDTSQSFDNLRMFKRKELPMSPAMPPRPRAPHMVQMAVSPAYISYQEDISEEAKVDTSIESECRFGNTAIRSTEHTMSLRCRVYLLIPCRENVSTYRGFLSARVVSEYMAQVLNRGRTFCELLMLESSGTLSHTSPVSL